MGVGEKTGPMADIEKSETALRGELDEVKIIATGGMAHIFRARQPSLGRYIVVKKLKEEFLTQPETLERFRREARALASILHQNVAHVYDFVESGRESYILMEYIDGVDLSYVIDKVGHLPPEVAVAAALGVAKGASYLHVHNLIHRDIKPSNIRLTTRGGVKLMDFGIVMDISNQGLTRPGLMVGSPSYLSPEQVLGDAITPSADVFLLGICLYEMLTGSRPFKDEGRETIYQRIREAKYTPPREMNSRIPARLDKIVRRCLQKDPSARFARVKDLICALEEYLGAAKSFHAEDILLKFLDGEALLSPTVGYTELADTDHKAGSLSLLKALPLAFLLLAVGFLCGYYCSRGGDSGQALLKKSHRSPFPRPHSSAQATVPFPTPSTR